MKTDFSTVFKAFSSAKGGRPEYGEDCAHSQLPTAQEYYSMAVNVLTLLELVALSLWANRLYCTDAAPFDHLEEEPELNQPGVSSSA